MSNTTCQLCGHNIPQGFPCMNCVDNKKMKKNQTVLTPDKIAESISVLSLRHGDIIVIKSDALRNDQEGVESISNGLQEVIDPDKKIGLMILDQKAEILLLRKVEDADANQR